MSPSSREIDGKRYWTPIFSLLSTVIGGTSFILWFFVSGWILDIKTAIQQDHTGIANITAIMAERHTTAAIWRTATTDKINFIDARLVKLENKVYDN